MTTTYSICDDGPIATRTRKALEAAVLEQHVIPIADEDWTAKLARKAVEHDETQILFIPERFQTRELWEYAVGQDSDLEDYCPIAFLERENAGPTHVDDLRDHLRRYSYVELPRGSLEARCYSECGFLLAVSLIKWAHGTLTPELERALASVSVASWKEDALAFFNALTNEAVPSVAAFYTYANKDDFAVCGYLQGYKY